MVQVSADAAGLNRVSGVTLPRTGTFWIMKTGADGDLTGPPYPFLPPKLSALPIYSVTNNIFIVDDTGGQLAPPSARRMSTAQAASAMQAQADTMANLIGQILYPAAFGGFQPNALMFDTNGLWLEASNETNYIGLRAHNTIGGDDYQLLSTLDLASGNWTLGQVLISVGGGDADFSPVPMTNAMTFFRVHHANPVFSIVNYSNSVELNITNTINPGHSGSFYLQNIGGATNDVTVYYSIGGTAQNGIDYASLSGSVIVSNSLAQAFIQINPTDVGLKPDQTVILTLLQNTNYLIDPDNYAATNILYANPQVYPIARGDKQPTCPNTSLAITLQATDPRNLSLTYSILTYPAHGNLTGTLPYMTYMPTNCYEGQDSFTFTASNGQFAATPATVTLIIADPVSADSPSVQTCRGTPVSFSLGSHPCSGTLGYALLSNPAHGTLSGTADNLTYTPTNTAYTGVESFNYVIYSGCGGDSAFGTVTITVGDPGIYAITQILTTGTNRSLTITLSATTGGGCKADTNYYTYTTTNGPTHGTLSGSGASLTYMPDLNYEGLDSFDFTARDGVWNHTGTINIAVTAGPILFQDCNPFGSTVLLGWLLDTNEQVMFPDPPAEISDFIVYRSAASGGPYTAIATNRHNATVNWLSYLDTNTVAGQTNYYVVTFHTANAPYGAVVQSPYSNEIKAAGQNLNPLISPDAVWTVVTNVNDLTPTLTQLQAPFSSFGTNGYLGIAPLPHTVWPVSTTWSNRITMFIPSNSVPLSQVTYSIAIDNDYDLYLNNAAAPIESVKKIGDAVWAPYKSFESIAPGVLHYGTNDLRVQIKDEGIKNYFSMIVSTNVCGH